MVMGTPADSNTAPSRCTHKDDSAEPDPISDSSRRTWSGPRMQFVRTANHAGCGKNRTHGSGRGPWAGSGVEGLCRNRLPPMPWQIEVRIRNQFAADGPGSVFLMRVPNSGNRYQSDSIRGSRGRGRKTAIRLAPDDVVRENRSCHCFPFAARWIFGLTRPARQN